MKKNTFLSILLYILLLFLPTEVSFSQGNTEITREELLDMVEQDAILEKQSVETTGSPYFFESFRDGKFVLANGKTSETFTMNYNIYENHIEIENGSSVLAIGTHKIKEFEFVETNNQMVFTKGYDSRGLDPEDVVLKLVEGDLTALLKYETSFQQNMASYGSATQKDEYITKSTLYLHRDGETRRIRRMRERRILRALDSHRDEMESFVDENNLDIEKISDLKLFFEYYNQLLKSR